MGNKYYTPELGEITTSIRHEVAYIGTNDWYKHEGLATDPLAQYRVKYLDRQDIEELGWEYNLDDSKYDGGYFLDCYYLTVERETYRLTHCNDRKTVRITHKQGITNSMCFFHGELKNFNNLQTLMKWLNIK